jgi:hypothetical protein
MMHRSNALGETEPANLDQAAPPAGRGGTVPRHKKNSGRRTKS